MGFSSSEARKHIEKEDDLINHRMGWCVGSNAFLIAAFAASGSATHTYSEVLRSTIPALGIAFTAICYCSIIAAYFAIWQWKSRITSGDPLQCVFHLINCIFREPVVDLHSNYHYSILVFFYSHRPQEPKCVPAYVLYT